MQIATRTSRISDIDVAIIGGGIVGMATALALTEQRDRSVLVLEAEPRLAAHQSGRNSGVIHAGLYYKPGSLKAKLCTEGRDSIYAFCREHGITHEQCGKLIVATREAELPRLAELERRGRANGLTQLRRVKASDLHTYEPAVRGIAGLHVGETGIVDFAQVLEAMARCVRDRGGDIRLGLPVIACRPYSKGVEVSTSRETFRANTVINCGGLQCDRIARRCGFRSDMRIVPFRGDYFELADHARGLVANLIYPVPDPRFPFLGAHFTRMIDGRVECGPNAVLSFKRHGYHSTAFSIRDASEIMCYPGCWRMAIRHFDTGMAELHRSFSKLAFLRALQRYVPELRLEDIRPARAGVRAQAVARDGRLIDDFVIERDGRLIHVLNAPSPAATASLPIGRSIADQVWRAEADA